MSNTQFLSLLFVWPFLTLSGAFALGLLLTSRGGFIGDDPSEKDSYEEHIDALERHVELLNEELGWYRRNMWTSEKATGREPADESATERLKVPSAT